ncbi:hypothetical protein F5Y04DRAFT_257611 [Hypomontagnella monticulosa]|nr:hypothetical protein F5Y04DRAFT_257611 [Hypomontagnella monticulosa]
MAGDVRRIGLTSLSPGNTNLDGSECQPLVNIIFVHGLMGHPKHTWEGELKPANEKKEKLKKRDVVKGYASRVFRPKKASRSSHSTADQLNSSNGTTNSQSSKVFWPKELLPLDISNARIYTYGYNADAIKGMFEAKNKNNIYQHALDMKAKLERLDNDEPMIFIAHSLGGIIVKDMLCQSTTLQERTKLIIFLGTPHRGSEASGWGQLVSNLAKAAFIDVNDGIFEGLKVDSEVLNRIHSQFKDVSESGIKIHSFYEGRGMTGVRGLHGRVVEPFSARLDFRKEIETVESIDADHRDMARFSQTSDEGYTAVEGVLSSFIRNMQNVVLEEIQDIRNDLDGRECLYELYVDNDYTTTRQNVPNRHPETCTWILEHQDLMNWVDDKTPSRLLWMSGNAGMGKTVMSKFLLETFEDVKYEAKTIYFFFSDRDETRSTAISFFKAVIHQLLSLFGRLFKTHVKPMIDHHGNHLYRSFGLLWQLFISIVKTGAVGRIYCVLDALDECEESSRNKLIEVLGENFAGDEAISDIPLGFKILVTSRPYETLRVKWYGFPIIRLRAEQEEIKINRDIARYVDDKVKDLSKLRGYAPDLEKLVRDALVHGADGMFLWVNLVVKVLETTHTANVAQRIEGLPKGIEAVYERLLAEVPEESVEEVSLILKWVVFAYRSLKLDELGIACAMEWKSYHSLSSIPSTAINGMSENLNLCGSLVKVYDDSTVHLVHQTTKHYLIRRSPTGQQIPRMFSWKSVTEIHNSISLVCLHYLSFAELEALSDPVKRLRMERGGDALIKKYELATYATTHWPDHIRESGLYGMEALHEALNRIIKVECNWKLLASVAEGTTINETKRSRWIRPHPLHTLITLELFPLAEKYIESSLFESNRKDGDGTTPLHLATKRGQAQLVRIILGKGADPNVLHTIEGLAHDEGVRTRYITCSPLHLATYNGNYEIVELLLKNRADPNIEERQIDYASKPLGAILKRTRTPLHIAVAKNRVRIAELLLNYGARVDARGTYGEIIPVQEEQTEDEDEEEEEKDPQEPVYEEWTPLQEAIAERRTDMVQLLLKRGAEISDAGDGKYMAPYELKPEGTRPNWFHPQWKDPVFLDANDMEVLRQLRGI